MSHYLAFDLGAESGRALLGSLSGGKLAVEELHRFPNTPVRVLGALYWDTLRLWHEIQHGIGVAARERNLALDGIGIDTWGVDYGLLGADGMLIDNPRHYRDSRTNGMMERLFETVPRDQVFASTGIQFMQLNTLYQLYAQKLAGSPALGAARRLLNMPDLFNYWLTGVAQSEATIASTTQ
jgi:rhamnulokinase